MTSDETREANAVRTPMQNFFARVNVDRILVIILILAVVVVGWSSVQTSKNYKNFTDCTVEYLVKDRAANTPTVEASRELVKANNEANGTITALLDSVLKINATPVPSQEDLANATRAIQATKEAYAKSDEKYDDYRESIKNNPRPPEPTTFCKERM